MHLHDTICALSTPPGRGALALIRMSGPEAYAILQAVFKSKTFRKELTPHRAYFGKLGMMING
jgi:tRNA modification GTPase